MPKKGPRREYPRKENKADLNTATRLCSIMAQILSIYGLVASVIISGSITEKMPIYTGFLQLGAGLAVGLCGMAAGFAIGIVGDAGGTLTTLMAPSQEKFAVANLNSTTQSVQARSSRACTWAWSSSSFLPKFWACTVSLSPSSCSPAPSSTPPCANTKNQS